MADYSGYWSCPECPASGTYLGTDTPHDAGCSVGLKALEAKLARKQKEFDKLRDEQLQQEILSNLSDETLYAWLWSKTLEAGDLHSEYMKIEKLRHAGLENLHRRSDTVNSKYRAFARARRDELHG